MLLLFIAGDLLGGGIYARTGEVAGEIGGAIWTGFALAALHPQGVQDAAADVRGGLRRHVLGFGVGGGAGDGVRGRLPERVRRPANGQRRGGDQGLDTDVPEHAVPGLGIAGAVYLWRTPRACCCCSCSSASTSRLIVLRGEPVDHEHFRAPTVLPWLGPVTCLGLAVESVVDDPKLVLWAGGLLLFGLILWFVEKAVR